MHKINCSVENCSFNNSTICVADRVNIGGIGAANEKQTCCGTFLDKTLYSDLSSKLNSNCELSQISCKANTCKYNHESHCSLDNIEVTGVDETKIYTETNCSSFKLK